MPSAMPAKDRRHDLRPGLKVKHRHRVGTAIVERVSELVHVRGRPVALLDWINLGGIRTPLSICASLTRGSCALLRNAVSSNTTV